MYLSFCITFDIWSLTLALCFTSCCIYKVCAVFRRSDALWTLAYCSIESYVEKLLFSWQEIAGYSAVEHFPGLNTVHILAAWFGLFTVHVHILAAWFGLYTTYPSRLVHGNSTNIYCKVDMYAPLRKVSRAWLFTWWVIEVMTCNTLHVGLIYSVLHLALFKLFQFISRIKFVKFDTAFIILISFDLMLASIPGLLLLFHFMYFLPWLLTVLDPMHAMPCWTLTLGVLISCHIFRE